MTSLADLKPIPSQEEGFARDMLEQIAFIRAFEETALKLTKCNLNSWGRN